VPCTGTAQVTPDGTLISGLEVPAGTGTALPIVLTTNNLGPKTLSITFRYSSVLPNNNDGGTTPGDNGTCVAGAGTSLAGLAMPALLGALALRRRRK